MSASHLTRPLKRAVIAAGKPQSLGLGAPFTKGPERDGQSPPATSPKPGPGQTTTNPLAVQLKNPLVTEPASLPARTLLTPVLGNVGHQQRPFASTSSRESETQSSVSPYQQLALGLEVHYNKVTLDLQALASTTSNVTLGKGELDCLTAIGVVGSIIPLMKTATPSQEFMFFRELYNAMNRVENTVVANKDSIARHHVDFDALLEDVNEMQKALCALEDESDSPSE